MLTDERTTKPVVSVIMPCYNHAAFVVESARAVLDQTFSELELLVVDDASRDCSLEQLRTLSEADKRVKVLPLSKNRGASFARNSGLAIAQGEYIAFCDADDLWHPEKLRRQLELLRANPEYDIAYCDAEIIDEKGAFSGQFFSDLFPPVTCKEGYIFEAISKSNFINMQTVMMRRPPSPAVPYFDESIKWVEDWWQWIKLAYDKRFIYDKNPLAKYRVHPQSTGFTKRPWIRRNRWKVFRRNLDFHPDIACHLKAFLWYQMGMELAAIGKAQLARRFFLRAMLMSVRGKGLWQVLPKAVFQTFRVLAKNYRRHTNLGHDNEH